jgi:hypothetical protein
MPGIWNWIGSNSSQINVIATVILVVITAVYVFLTRDMLKDSRESHHRATQPEVVVTVQESRNAYGFLDMVIENLGPSPAYDLRFEVSSPVQIRQKRELREIGLFQDGMAILAPRQNVRFFLASTYERFDELMDTRFDVVAKWRSLDGEVFERSFPIRFDHLRNMSSIGSDPGQKAAKQLEAISKTLDHISTGFKKPQVITYTPDEIHRENRGNWLYVSLKHLDDESLEKVVALVKELEKRQEDDEVTSA